MHFELYIEVQLHAINIHVFNFFYPQAQKCDTEDEGIDRQQTSGPHAALAIVWTWLLREEESNDRSGISGSENDSIDREDYDATIRRSEFKGWVGGVSDELYLFNLYFSAPLKQEWLLN